DGLGVEAQFLQRGAGEARELDGEKAVAVEGVIFERTYFDLRFAQIGFLEVVKVDDQDAVLFEVREIHSESRGIHGDERVDGITRRVNIARRKMDLKAADAGKSACRGANLCGIVGGREPNVVVKSEGLGEVG